MNPLYEKPFLCANLSFIYRLIVASAPLLVFAESRSKGALREYFAKHLTEETGHDEMLKKDLGELGVEQIPEYFCAAEIAGSQYYLIAHKDPAMLLGYMAVLEATPFPEEFIAQLEAHHGVALTALRHHAKHDPEHFAELCEVIDSLPESLQHAIGWNMNCTRQALQNALDALRTH